MSKTPIYKRKWFIIVAVIIIIGVIGSQSKTDKPTKVDNNSANEATSSNSTTTTPSQEETANDHTSNNESESKPEPKPEPEPSVTTYKSGMYKVGTDIPAGEYNLIADDNTFGAYVELNKDSKGDMSNIIANDNFTTHIYITVKDGEYLKLQSCKAIPMDESTAYEPVDEKYEEGMYKVGKDLLAGEYKIVMKEDNIMGTGYYEVNKKQSS